MRIVERRLKQPIERDAITNGAADIMRTRKIAASAKERRSNELRAMLEGRLHEMVQDIQGRIRGARTDNANDRDVIDQGEVSEIDIQDEIQFALIQMKAETLKKIDTALRRLEEGTYGDCFECGNEIAEARLRALPFAVRCKDCEEAREIANQRERNLSQRRNPTSLFFDTAN
jgi:DnaK suppressor protein